MPEGWQWDETLFRGSATYYEQGRLPYAPGYATVLADGLGQDGQGRLLDVGCGPGTVALAMAPYFAEVVGVDPDPDMLIQARRSAERLRGLNEFERDLRALLHEASPDGAFAEQLPDTEIRFWRKPAC